MFTINEIKNDLALLGKSTDIDMNKIFWAESSDKLVYECRGNSNVDLSIRILHKDKQILINKLKYACNIAASENSNELFAMYINCINKWDTNSIADIYIEQDNINIINNQEPALIFTFRESIKNWGEYNAYKYCKTNIEKDISFLNNVLFPEFKLNGKYEGIESVSNKLYTFMINYPIYQIGFFRRNGKDYIKMYFRYVSCEKISEAIEEMLSTRIPEFLNPIQKQIEKYSRVCVLDFTWDLQEEKFGDIVGISFDKNGLEEGNWKLDEKKKVNGVEVFCEKRYVSHHKLNIDMNRGLEYKKYYEHLKRNMFYKREEYLMH